MNGGFIGRMIWRESRGTRRRLALYMTTITLGVTALVAINGFREDVTLSLRQQSQSLLGADLEIRSRRPFADSVNAVVDSLVAAGDRVAHIVSLGSMVYAERSQLSRLAQIRALDGDFPFYGRIETVPADAWSRLSTGSYAVVDPSLLVYLDAAIGDTVTIGEARVTILGTLLHVPGDVALEAAIGPRVYVPAHVIEGTSLLGFGTRAQWSVSIALANPERLQPFLNSYNARFEAWQVRYDTVAEREEDFTEVLDRLSRFLAMVGLLALLLGGTGVASAVHVYVRERIPTIATLRCLGATGWQAGATYLLLAAGMAFGGALVGAGLGALVQVALPRVLQGFLPVAVAAHLHWGLMLSGVGIGTWIGVVFAALPLLAIRRVSPLRAIRADVEPVGRDPLVGVAAVVIGLTITGLAIWQAPSRFEGLLFAAAIIVTGFSLWTVAKLLELVMRRAFPRRAPYVVRQGISNLFRPHNQTVAVTVSVGFGLFLLATLDLVRRNLVRQFELDGSDRQANIVAFDVQPDQRTEVVEVFRRHGVAPREIVAIVPARLTQINGLGIEQLLHDSGGPVRSRWPLRREYRHTYRDTLVETEVLLRGTWWDTPRAAAALPRISLEEDIASELAVDIGDRITWDFQGVSIETEVASLRRVDWARFSLNFFAVFEPGTLDDVPQIYVVTARVDDVATRGIVQRDIVRGSPNVALLDVSTLMRALETILRSATTAVRFVALFSLICGGVVLVGAVATSRYQRLRESVLLRTLGASSRQVMRIALVEYVALGTVAAVTGILLAGLAAWGLARFFFEIAFRPSPLPVIVLALGAAFITVAVGLIGSRDALSRPPLAILRDVST